MTHSFALYAEAINRRDARAEAEIRRQDHVCPICKGKIVVERLTIFCANAPYCQWTGTLSY